MVDRNTNATNRIPARQPDGSVEIFNEADLPDAVSGTIPLASVIYSLSKGITIASNVSLEDIAITQFNSAYRASNFYIYTGTAVEFEMDAADSGLANFLINNLTNFSVGGGDLFDIRGTFGSLSLGGTAGLGITRAVFFGSDSLGLIDFMGTMEFSDSFFTTFTTGLVLNDCGQMSLNNLTFTATSSGSDAALTIQGETGQHSLTDVRFNLGSGRSGFRVDPGIPDAARISFNNARSEDPATPLFDVSGVDGTFTAVADDSLLSVTITGVSAGTAFSGGNAARFAYTAVPAIFVNQRVDVTGFTTNPGYNNTGIISVTDGSTYFEVRAVIFVADEASGSVDFNSIKVTDTGTTLVDGDTITITGDGSVDYNGGAYVYAAATNDFNISRPFTSTQSGVWSTRGLDQTDPRVSVVNSPGYLASNYLGCATAAVNTATTSFNGSTYEPLGFNTLAESSVIERFQIIDFGNGTLVYTGNEPIEGFITMNGIMQGTTGGAVPYSFQYFKSTDDGSTFVALPDEIPAITGELGNGDPGSFTTTVPVSLEPGDQLRPEGISTEVRSAVVINFSVIVTT